MMMLARARGGGALLRGGVWHRNILASLLNHFGCGSVDKKIKTETKGKKSVKNNIGPSAL
jgi:hypothetical protein